MAFKCFLKHVLPCSTSSWKHLTSVLLMTGALQGLGLLTPHHHGQRRTWEWQRSRDQQDGGRVEFLLEAAPNAQGPPAGPLFPIFFFLNTSIYFSVLLTELRGIRESLLRVVRVELWSKRGRVGQRLPLFFLSLKRKGLQLAVQLHRHLRWNMVVDDALETSTWERGFQGCHLGGFDNSETCPSVFIALD